jgi:lipopolysaccharide export system protein LptC
MDYPNSTSTAVDRTLGRATTGQPDRARAFRIAARHSWWVRATRIGLPVCVVLGIGGTVLANWLQPMRVLEKLPSVGKLAVSGSKITMETPRIAGFTRDSRAYEFIAKTAVQDIASPDIVELRDLRAKMDMQDGSAVELTALNGVYNTKTEQLALRDDIYVVMSSGYRGKLREASVDVRKGQVTSEQPVHLILPNGVLDANRLEVVESGNLIRFDRGVVMTLNPEEPAPAPVANQRTTAR